MAAQRSRPEHLHTADSPADHPPLEATTDGLDLRKFGHSGRRVVVRGGGLRRRRLCRQLVPGAFGGALLGFLLAAPLAHAEAPPADDGGRLERLLVVRSAL